MISRKEFFKLNVTRLVDNDFRLALTSFSVMSSLKVTSLFVNFIPVIDGDNDIPKRDVICIVVLLFVSCNRCSFSLWRGLISREMQYSFSCSIFPFSIFLEFNCLAVLLSLVTAVLIPNIILSLINIATYCICNAIQSLYQYVSYLDILTSRYFQFL